MFKHLLLALFALLFLASAHEHTHTQSAMKLQGFSLECTFKCSKYNACMLKGAWNGDISQCGEEPAGCKCVW
ncbi:hypothetical protein FGO68_gene1408 [Halteria grandinella]|uniref:Uncharacterized protein n=1 Tax=Halteria grandinella TaxID=5974 RepID=A0A8J8SYB3_HALGN|nr:hypothetical protein FGO68_gene1408 [Halteria grandinella]